MEAKSRTQKDAGLSRNGRQGSDSSFPISKGGCDLSMSVRIKPGAFAPDKLAQRLPFQRALAVPCLSSISPHRRTDVSLPDHYYSPTLLSKIYSLLLFADKTLPCETYHASGAPISSFKNLDATVIGCPICRFL